jgi:hypothetical protein
MCLTTLLVASPWCTSQSSNGLLTGATASVESVRSWPKPAVRGRAEPVRSARVFHINLFRYCQGVIYFDAQVSDRAFDLGMTKEKLNGPEVSCPPIDQGRFCASQRMRPKGPLLDMKVKTPNRRPRVTGRTSCKSEEENTSAPPATGR